MKLIQITKSSPHLLEFFADLNCYFDVSPSEMFVALTNLVYNKRIKDNEARIPKLTNPIPRGKVKNLLSLYYDEESNTGRQIKEMSEIFNMKSSAVAKYIIYEAHSIIIIENKNVQTLNSLPKATIDTCEHQSKHAKTKTQKSDASSASIQDLVSAVVEVSDLDDQNHLATVDKLNLKGFIR